MKRVPYNKGKSAALDWLRAHVASSHIGCLAWPFSHTRGYPQVPISGKVHKAHRLMCRLAHGDPPTPKHEAAHLCGNSWCINPRHLAWKTRSENQADSVAMGRFYNSGRRGKLGRANALKIRALKGRLSQNKIAEKFGVTYSTVAKIHRGEIWK